MNINSIQCEPITIKTKNDAIITEILKAENSFTSISSTMLVVFSMYLEYIGSTITFCIFSFIVSVAYSLKYVVIVILYFLFYFGISLGLSS